MCGVCVVVVVAFAVCVVCVALLCPVCVVVVWGCRAYCECLVEVLYASMGSFN